MSCFGRQHAVPERTVTDEELYAIEKWMEKIERASMNGKTNHGTVGVAFRYIVQLIAEVRRLRDLYVEDK